MNVPNGYIHQEEDAIGQGSDDVLLSSKQLSLNKQQYKMECRINPNMVNELICQGYKRSWWKSTLSLLSVVCSCGFVLLVFYWRPDWELKCTSSRTTFNQASHVLLQTTDETKQVFVSVIEHMPVELTSLIPSYKPSPQSQLSNGTAEVDAYCYGTNMDDEVDSVTFFIHHLSKFVWNLKLQTFVELGGLDGQLTIAQIHQDSNVGLDESESEKRSELFGMNLITVEIPSHIQLLLSEILNPFYIFQLSAVVFWMFDDYYIYASAIFVMSLVSAVTSLIEIRKERTRLHNMVEYHNETMTEVIRNGAEPVQIWSKDLVPGDVIVIPPAGVQLACDAVLASGTCIVNESMLTGESVPVTKTRLPTGENEMQYFYDMELHKRHTLFCGTQVLQTRNYGGDPVKAVVVRTGYHTAKGRLVHSILFPKPVDMKLLRDAYRFVFTLFLIAMCGLIYTVVIQSLADEGAKDIALNAIDLITISVPPALPLAMTIGILYAQNRLKLQKIHCISPQRINISGQVDVVAFDKTGTLTEEGLDLHLLLPVNHQPNSTSSSAPKFKHQVLPDAIVEELGIDNPLLHCMVCCHTLTTIDGQLTGDPLDLKMFEAAGWKLLEPSVSDQSKFEHMNMTYVRPSKELLFILNKSGLMTSSDSIDFQENQIGGSCSKQLTVRCWIERFDKQSFVNVYVEFRKTLTQKTPTKASGSSFDTSAYDIGIICQFPFSSSLQRASVIVKSYRSKPKEMMIYMKGAPETVAGLCRPETVPPDFHEVLKGYTQQGLRVIGAACKPFSSTWHKARKVERKFVESDLTFLGLIALENKLKPQSAGALRKLQYANIRSLMVTGDNILTSLSVARECGLIHLHDSVLMANAAPPTLTSPATLKWTLSDEPQANGSTSQSSSFSSSEVKVLKEDNSLTICMGDQSPQSWHLAVSGPSYAVIKEHFPKWMEILAVKGTVFARMSPSQKTSLMEELQDVGYHVCMCGDGANDCGALKRAHAGISLSEYEASVAAPFMSHTDLGIECVPTLIREGRAALVTSFGMFKFMALYSIIQFCSITILYNRLSNLGDLQYLYIDLIIIDLVALTMSRNHAYKSLKKHRPPTSLTSAEMLASLAMQILLQLSAQLCIFFLVRNQCWYTDLTPAEAKNSTVGNNITCPQLNHVQDQSHVENEDRILTYENSAIFFLSSFLYLSVSVAFSRGRPFRTPIYKNRWFVASLIFLVAFTLFQMFFSPLEFDDLMQTRQIPDIIFLIIILCVAGCHFLLSVAFEMLIIEQPKLWTSLRRLCRCLLRNHVSKRYKVILQDLDHSFDDVSIEDGGTEVPSPLHLVNKTMLSNGTDCLS